MKSLLPAVILFATSLTSSLSSYAAATDRPFERSVFCGIIISRYEELIPGTSAGSKLMQCRDEVSFAEDGSKLWVTLFIQPTMIICPAIFTDSKTGLDLGDCEVAEAKPRFGVSN